METPNKFRNASGARLTKSLFFETNKEGKELAVYTLKDKDHLGLPSLYRLYLETADPLEYTFANLHLDGWEHWTMLCNCTWFQEYLTRWRHELELKIRSEALVRLWNDAKSTSRSAAVSNRFLLDRGWVLEGPTKGRPTKADVRKAAKAIAEASVEQDEDFARITAPLVLEPKDGGFTQ